MTTNNADFDIASRRRGIRTTVTLLLVIVALVLGLTVYKVLRPKPLDGEELRALNAIVFDKPRRLSDFSLVDHHNKPFSREQLQGKWSLIFFGFTHCPDICPMTLVDMDNLKDVLPPELASKTQILLVSLDPARDTPEELATYLANFDEEFIGVTGDFLAIRRFANEVNVAFAKVTQGDDYTVDHSANIVLINPMGDYHGFFKPPFEIDKLHQAYAAIVKGFRF